MDQADQRAGAHDTTRQDRAAPAQRRIPPEISFGDFAALARRRGSSVDDLADRFRGQIDDPREFFKRVLQGQYVATVIPFNSVIAFYQRERGFLRLADPKGRVCAWGCGAPVLARRGKWASAACKKRAQRSGHSLPENARLSALFYTGRNRDISGGGYASLTCRETRTFDASEGNVERRPRGKAGEGATP